LITNSRYVIGQLYGGSNVNCSNPSQDIAVYGKFSVSWTGNGATDNRRRLDHWLDPIGTNPITIDGRKIPTLSGPSTVCNQATFTINNLPQGATVKWSASPTGIVDSIQSNGNSATITAISSGTFTLNATVTFSENTIALTKQIISLGGPYINYYSNNNLVMLTDDASRFQVLRNYDNSQYAGSLTVSVSDGSVVQWSKISGTMSWSSYLNTVTVFGKKTSSLILESSAINSCGTASKRFTFYIGVTPFLIYPNPATDMLTVEVASDESEDMMRTTSTSIEPYTIQLWHERSGLVRTLETSESLTQISLKGLPKGMYFVHVVKDGEVVKKQILWVR